MNKIKILEYLMENIDGDDLNDQLIEELEQAKSEMDSARSMFDNVNDSKLIEVAIFAEEVAKKRYEYLLRLAKAKGIKVNHNYILQKNISVK
ncbi:YaaL family protein [Clostridium weizhouense]|uniref:YaaL family protein n=1 Tax=Clostridium weizhouense TaxID=2859781 RepID=A0ABS7AS77_9CLOT|nr:YaaL family protein [Clostridium weizhouense]MBW6411520.1 YaaL family protein [Clostridium weizhouense]